MAEDGRFQALMLATLIGLLAIVGIFVIVGLGWAFRRAGRLRRGRQQRGSGYVDTWRESGRRAAPVDTTQDEDDER